MTREFVVFVALAGFASASGLHAAESLTEALEETQPLINWRLRYENVDQVGIAAAADAFTSRLRAGFQTGEWGRTSLLGELAHSEGIIDDYNSTTNGKPEYPVVADPGGFTTINRFALTNKSFEKTALTLGRQRIVLDDSRFVGNVGWRQNEQTYDGLRAQFDGEAFDVDVSYITQVNRIFGPDSPVGKWNGDVVLLNASKSFAWGKLTGFAYGLDLDEAAALSSNTLGWRVSGSKSLERLTIQYTASLARQTDAGRNPASYSESYHLLEGGLRLGKLTVALGQEKLGSDGTNAVATPLATLHAFQGWADQFLATPAAGIDNGFVRMAYQHGPLGRFTAFGIESAFHVISAAAGSADYGDELDVSLFARTERLTWTLKYASYSAESLFTDTDKLWLSMDYGF